MGREGDRSRFRPPQHQHRQPGIESDMEPMPDTGEATYVACGKLTGRAAIITGGDSGIGRAVAVAFAKEGADVAIVYLNEHDDAEESRQLVERESRRCVTLAVDIAEEHACRAAVNEAIDRFGRLDILVNNAAEQHLRDGIEEISAAQLERTFKTNIFSYFYMTKAALRHMKRGGAIINTASVTAYTGSERLIDDAATKGAIVAFTRSLSRSLVRWGIRVNAVAPGPVWTPLIPASYSADEVASFGSDVPMCRAGEPAEIAPCYVFLASGDSSYMTGQVLHPNGGEAVGG